MYKEVALENQIKRYNTKIEEIEIKLETLMRQEENLLNELKVTQEQLSVFISDPQNFTAENWAELSKQQSLLNEKLSRELDNIRNPQKTKQAYSSLNVKSHWLYVK